MWTAASQPIDEQVTRFTLRDDSAALSFHEVIGLCSVNAAFREFLTVVLSSSPLEAFFWEVAPVTSQTLDHPFEFVLVSAPALSRLHADPAPFRAHFSAHPSADVLTFPNLGGDAVLVVPAPLADDACYPHLGRFLRSAPRSQVDSFWRHVGVAMQARLSTQPTWLSTAGLGVSWLHLRLDSRPKYYRHLPYKTQMR